MTINEQQRSKVAILYIATGRYPIFWKEFYKSSEKYFLPGCEKCYFVFTDTHELLFDEVTNHRIIKVYQKKLGWPHDTLMRFDMFLKIEDELKSFDYIFFLNANLLFVKPVTSEILPAEKEALVGVLHPGFYNKDRNSFTYDDNPRSLACIPKGEGENYFMGGFNGGRSKEYIELIRTLDRNIKIDLSNNVVALWHDESHMNRYLLDHPCKVLEPIYGMPEKKFPKNIFKDRRAKVIIRDKARSKYGGHMWLRGETDKRKFNLLAIFKPFD